MIIRELVHEARDICNGLFQAINQDEESFKRYESIYAKSKLVFDMIKHGNIMPETVDRLHDQMHRLPDS